MNSKFKTQNSKFVFLIFAAFCSLLTVKAQLNSGAQQNVNGETGSFAILNAKIFTVSGETINNGYVLIRDGKIAAVGSGSPQIGANTKTIDAKGASVYPGMIDAATNMGLSEVPLGAPGTEDSSETGDMNPNARALIAVNPNSSHINVTRVNGITTVLTMPQGNVISGQAAVINLVGQTQSEMALNPAFALVINFPRVATFGGFGQPPVDFNEAVKRRDTRLEELRKILREAENYGKMQDAFAKDATLPRPRTDLKLAALVPFVRGEKPVMFMAIREVDIRGAIRFADEMKLRAIIVGGDDAFKVADLLKQKNIPVIITNVWKVPLREDDAYDSSYTNAGKLFAAGVKFCIGTGDHGANVRDLPYQAGVNAAYNLPKEEALKAVTIYPAQILGIADKVGSIETGKIANLVVADGDILQPTTNVLHLFIAGRKIPLTNRQTELYEQFKDRKLPNQN
jgi:imidazolonepropionase-like amidohydrolase